MKTEINLAGGIGNQLGIWIARMLCCAMFLGGFGKAQASTSALRNSFQISGGGFVKEARGVVEFSFDDRNWQPLRKFQSVPGGTTIRASQNGEALLLLDETENYLRITAGNQIKLEKSVQQKAAELLAQKQGANLEGSARIRAVRGKAEYFQDKEWHVLKVNTTLPQGTIIRTKYNSTADLFFPGKGLVVRMTPETVIRLDQMNFTWNDKAPIIESLLVVAQGQILTNPQPGGIDAGNFRFQQAQVLYQIHDNSASMQKSHKRLKTMETD